MDARIGHVFGAIEDVFEITQKRLVALDERSYNIGVRVEKLEELLVAEQDARRSTLCDVQASIEISDAAIARLTDELAKRFSWISDNLKRINEALEAADVF